MKVVCEKIREMAPLKQTRAAANTRAVQKTQVTIATRSRSSVLNAAQERPKRKADFSPVKDNVKRMVMGDLTNTKVTDDKKKATIKQPIKKAIVQTKTLPSVRTVAKPKHKENVVPHAPCIAGIVTRAAVKSVATNQTAIKPKEPSKEVPSRIKTRLSNEFEKTEESLYSSALEELNDTFSSSGSKKEDTTPKSAGKPSETGNLSVVSIVAKQLESKLNLGNHEVPEGIDDYDKENLHDIVHVANYAMDIFNYYKSREHLFDIPDYIEKQSGLTTWMRSLLVDWMVEVQESFELNHESLYLGVRLLDLYLSKVNVDKERLQLVGATCMLIACKYDERIPPSMDDILYVCDGAYSRREVVRMEMSILKICDFNLGMPISYRFLRRYARCGKITMPILTLARFILEYSLMDYATVTIRPSKLAAASLFLALKMKKLCGWTPALEFYSGYRLEDIKSTVIMLNDCLKKKLKSPLMTVKNKYSHEIFYEVAKTPLLANEVLF